MLAKELLESVELLSVAREAAIGRSARSVTRLPAARAGCRPAGHVGQGQDVLLDLGREAEQAHDLGDPSTGDAFQAGDGDLRERTFCESFQPTASGYLR
jgi:hypothetical protein